MDYRDRDRWPKGPWDDEPDEATWIDEPTGYRCQGRRNTLGAWCGYVGISSEHVFYEIDFDVAEAALSVHGGMTFAGRFELDDPLFWFGFDCNHSWDIAPEETKASPFEVLFEGRSYRDLSYVKSQCSRLAAQLWDAHEQFAVDRAEAVAWLLKVRNEHLAE